MGAPVGVTPWPAGAFLLHTAELGDRWQALAAAVGESAAFLFRREMVASPDKCAERVNERG